MRAAGFSGADAGPGSEHDAGNDANPAEREHTSALADEIAPGDKNADLITVYLANKILLGGDYGALGHTRHDHKRIADYRFP